MAVVVLAVGTALFCDWLVEPGSAPAETQVELRSISGELAIAGAIRVASLMIGVQVVGSLSLVVLSTLSGVRCGA
ncbi:MAG: hypothetical protein CVV35_00460 [Methanomicrobiales archaeon HGW-Methanomicrobiales-6]|jgi:multicomponent Na+:H+ antiporter subunit B|nr:hypothetical protein [Methanoculleus sp.]PKL57365.1 MAG: hypothetical protein CVV35_00460 [Methanomicrobiales archaeon HGW-Methanomicrobiales-6]